MGGGMGKRRKERGREGAPGKKAEALQSQNSRPSVFNIGSASQGPPGCRTLGLKRYSQHLKQNPVPACPSFSVTSLVHLSAAQSHETWQRKTVSRSLWGKEQGGPEATQTGPTSETLGHSLRGDLRSRQLLTEGSQGREAGLFSDS